MRSDDLDFRELVKENQERVLNTCYRFVHDRQDAEDLTQEVFLEVYGSLKRFRGEAKLSTWIYRIAVTKSLDFLRRQKRKKRFAQAKRVLGFEDNPLPDIRADEKSQPDELLHEQERQRILKEAVSSLPENQRVAIVLNKYEGIRQKDIAQIMGSTVPAVESLIHRGMVNLRKYLLRHYRDRSGRKLASSALVFWGGDV